MSRVLTLAMSMLLFTASARAEKPAAKSPAIKAEPAKSAAPSSPAAVAFERLKSLAGTWTWQHDGKTEVALQTRVSSRNSAIVETMFPGTPHEMTNVYTLDGDSILVTHYCAEGNQPRMAAQPTVTPGALKFALRDATGVDPKTGDYMGELILTILDADHLVQEWRHFKAGKPGEVARFELARGK